MEGSRHEERESASICPGASNESACTVSLTFLPHLDGIRAVALFGVLGFHFKAPFARNGFLGVDSFLVLSGYLMTRNILAAMKNASFEIVKFYKARFWRLYPTALCVTGLTIAAAFFLSDSTQALETCQSGLATLFLSSNIYFYRHSTYFDASADQRPLLHTWSLAVEEQFYLFWPAMLVFNNYIAANYCRAQRSLWLVLISLFSLLVLLASKERFSQFSFYLLPTRVFEFGLGGLLLMHENNFQLEAFVNDILSGVGLILVAGTYTFDSKSHLRLTFLNLLGTLLLIATPTGVVNQYIMSNSYMRRVGKLSYAAYLTHWPIWVYATVFLPDVYSNFLLLGCTVCAATFTSAYILHRFVEVPFRFKKAGKLFLLSPIFAVVLTTALYGQRTKGWSFRFSPVLSHEKNLELLRRSCYSIEEQSTAVAKREKSLGCVVGIMEKTSVVQNATSVEEWIAQNQIRAVIVGNSFSEHLLGAFLDAHRQNEAPYLFMYQPMCGLLRPSSIEGQGDHNRPCQQANQRKWSILKSLAPGTLVLLAENWGIGPDPTEADGLKRHLGEIVKNLTYSGARPVFVSPPSGGSMSPLCLDMQRSIIPALRRLARLFMKCQGETPPLQDTLRAARAGTEFCQANRVSHIDLFWHLCPSEMACRMFATLDGKLQKLYAGDGRHLSYWGSKSLGPFFQKSIDALL